MNGDEAMSWQNSLANTYHAFTSLILAHAPQIIGALALMVAGWLIALLLRLLTRKLVRGFDSVFNRVAGSSSVRQESIKRSYVEILGNIVFWTVLIFFIAAAANVLGWNMFANWMSSIVAYLPNLVTGLVIILAGFLLSNFARTAVFNATQSTGIKQSELLARVTQIILLFTSLVIGIEQIGINVGFLTNVLIVVIGLLLFGGTLAFSLGAKTLVANVIGAQYFRKHCRIGEKMQIGDISGVVVEVSQTSIVLDTGNSRTVVPAKQFQEQVTQFMSPHNKPKESDNAVEAD